MSVVLGFIFMTAWVTETNRQSRERQLVDADQKDRILNGPIDLQDRYVQLRAHVAELQQQNSSYEKALAGRNDVGKLLNDKLEKTEMFACLTPIEGPGVIVTMRDGAKSDVPGADITIHDGDVLAVVNELWLSGAEAISVNDIRLSPRSTIRCIGPVIQVDTREVATPIVIQAVGSPKVLDGGLQNLPGGIIQTLQATDPNMASVETAKDLKLPPYDGATEFKFGKVPKENR
jgi:uncharacterized protein YlxW (UPF0749 family)